MLKIIVLVLFSTTILFSSIIDTKNELKNVKEPKLSISAEKDFLLQKHRLEKGKSLYVKCVSCHGLNAEKSALNQSNVIKGMSENAIIESLVKYQKNDFKDSKKNLMKKQVENLEKNEIKALASYISSLK
jgi:cytochrome c553